MEILVAGFTDQRTMEETARFLRERGVSWSWTEVPDGIRSIPYAEDVATVGARERLKRQADSLREAREVRGE